MTELERTMLAIVADQAVRDGRQERAAGELGMSLTQVVQRVNAMLGRPDVIAECPVTVHRLIRLREGRLRRRGVRR